MPQFRTSNQLLKHSDYDDFWDENFMERYDVYFPPTYKWDYKKDMQFEDVYLWELIYEESGLRGLYASYIPYAEFYLLLTRDYEKNMPIVKFFYGQNCLKNIKKEMKNQNLKWPLSLNKIWVDEEDMWLHDNSQYNSFRIIETIK